MPCWKLAMSTNHVSITLSTNRPNITYATTLIIGTLHSFHGLNCLIPTNFHPPMDIPKTLVFHDSKLDATNAAWYINSRLPIQRGTLMLNICSSATFCPLLL